jgi:hypothetical protein
MCPLVVAEDIIIAEEDREDAGGDNGPETTHPVHNPKYVCSLDMFRPEAEI